MTFTEAAIVVLRQVGRPLHYRKITELAIGKHLLSHVGKTPEVTMSARLAMVAKKLDTEQPIIKVKPGVFGLREFSEEVMASAAAEGGDEDIRVEDFDIPEELLKSVQSNEESEADEDSSEASAIFPEEDDDDEPILAGLDESRGDSDRGSRRRKRRRNRAEGPNRSGDDKSGRDDRDRDDRGGRNESRQSHALASPYKVAGDWDREPEDDELTAKGLADAIVAVLDAEDRQMRTLEWVAERLVRKGRLQGAPRALAPTLAAAVRADNASRMAEGKRVRFRLTSERLWLTDWLLPANTVSSEEQIRRLAREQRLEVFKLFLQQVGNLPLAGFAELVASWLNAEGVHAVRAVRRPGSSSKELHFAGVQRFGRNEVHVAIVVRRDGGEIDKAQVERTRGALHHYGNASAAWLLTLGKVSQEARSETQVAGAAPVLVFDGFDWAEALENVGIGLERHQVALVVPQFELLAALRGDDDVEVQDASASTARDRDRGEGRNRRGRRRRRGGRDRDRNRDQNGSDSENRDGSEVSASSKGESSEDSFENSNEVSERSEDRGTGDASYGDEPAAEQASSKSTEERAGQLS